MGSGSPTGRPEWVLSDPPHPVDGDREPFPVVATDYGEYDAVLSPDGNWVAYLSDESGQFEVYVTSFPEPGRKWQISSGGGDDPSWAPDGKGIYYFSMSRNHLKSQILAVRDGEWKLFRKNIRKKKKKKGGTKYILYNLKKDIGETKDFSEGNEKVVSRMKKAMIAFNKEVKGLE